MNDDGKAMTGRYTVTCPYCATSVRGAAPAGIFTQVGEAAKALNAHMRYTCPVAPRLRTQQRDELAASQVRSID